MAEVQFTFIFGDGCALLPEEVKEFIEEERKAQVERAFQVAYREFSEQSKK